MNEQFRFVSDHSRLSYDLDGRLIMDVSCSPSRDIKDEADHGKTSAYDRSVAFDRKPFERLIFDAKHGPILQSVQPREAFGPGDFHKRHHGDVLRSKKAHVDLGHQPGRWKIFASLRHRLGQILIRTGRSLSELPRAEKASPRD